MSLPLDAATVLQALDLELDHEPVDPAEVVDGSPTTGLAELTVWGGSEVGVWEITPGTVTAVEEAEVFIVLRGHATLRRGDGTTVELVAGSIGRLDEGEETSWTVHETLRKVYVA